MKSIFLTFLLLAARAMAVDYALPSANQGWWLADTNVGVVGGIAQYGNGVPTTGRSTASLIDASASPYNADKTGATSAVAAIQAAWDAASSGGGVYLPAGLYKIDGQINIQQGDDNKTLRGTTGTILYGTGLNISMFAFAGGGADTGTDAQTVTGTKTKGTAALTVSSSAGYSMGMLATVIVENETDNARIIAGAAPTWSHTGYPDLRQVQVRVTAVAAGLITVDPPLPWDCTNYATRIEHGTLDWRLEKIGFENFAVTFDAAAHPAFVINFGGAIECWATDITANNWLKNSDSGSIIYLAEAYRCELRRIKGITPTPASYSDDGFLQIASCSNCLIEDNIGVGWGYGIYNSGGTTNNVIAYNYLSADTGLAMTHNAHPSLDLYEGNVTTLAQTDNYHGSSSHLAVVRNWVSDSASQNPTGLTYATTFGRFSRYHAIVGNVFGQDGVITGLQGYGNPTFSGNANGFAGPTGTSAAAGTYDYRQNFGTPFTYQIQSGDIFSGDWWADWKNTGTLTTRTSASAGVVTATGGDWVANGAGSALVTLRWGGGASARINMQLTSVAGNVLTLTGGSGTDLPTVSTVFDSIWPGPNGFNERDLDVEPSTIKVENYSSAAEGTGSISNGTASVLPVSYVHASKPAWFGNLTWPPVNPDAPVFSIQIIPAGYRFVNESGPPPDTAPPELVSAVISEDGDTITFTLDEAGNVGAGGSSGWEINLSSGSATLTYASGDGTTALVYTISSTITPGITGDVAYTQPGNGIEDGAGNDLATLSGFAITNNSTAGAASITQAGWSRKHALKILSQ